MRWRPFDEDRWYYTSNKHHRWGVVERFADGWFWSLTHDPHWHEAPSKEAAEQAVERKTPPKN
jgi:hypothetical protein